MDKTPSWMKYLSPIHAVIQSLSWPFDRFLEATKTLKQSDMDLLLIDSYSEDQS